MLRDDLARLLPVRPRPRFRVCFEFCHWEESPLRDDEAIQLDRRGALRAPRDDNHFQNTT